MNLSVAGGGSIERASGTRMERKFDRRARLVERPATTDYIYAYLMRVHNARERGAMTRRSRGGGGGGGARQPCFSSPCIRPSPGRWNVDIFHPLLPLMLFIAMSSSPRPRARYEEAVRKQRPDPKLRAESSLTIEKFCRG